MAYSESQTRTWNRSTANDGLYWDVEFTRIYGNFNLIVDNGGSAPPRTMTELDTDLTTAETDIDKLSNTITKTNDYTILNTDYYSEFIGDTTSNDVDFTLPDLASNYGRKFRIIHIDGSNEVNVVRAGTDVITEDNLTNINLPKPGNYIEVFASQSAGAWLVMSENIACHWEAHTHAGYGGAGWTLIPYFSTVVKDYGDVFSVANNNTEGLTITINKSGMYSFSYSSTSDVGGNDIIGISENTTQGTTSISSINAADRRTEHQQSAVTAAVSCSWSGWLDAGTDIRPHNNAAFTPNGNKAAFSATYIGS